MTAHERRDQRQVVATTPGVEIMPDCNDPMSVEIT
jgi:hypothetical protein